MKRNNETVRVIVVKWLEEMDIPPLTGNTMEVQYNRQVTIDEMPGDRYTIQLQIHRKLRRVL